MNTLDDRASADSNSVSKSDSKQFATFYIGDRRYGIDVRQVQEVTQSLPVTKIRLAPPFVKGLINLRGQIATAIGLRDLFGLDIDPGQDSMTVVCRVDGNLLSLLVDRIGDVVEVSDGDYEAAPDTIHPTIKRFMLGVYKSDGPLLSVIGIDNINQELNGKTDN